MYREHQSYVLLLEAKFVDFWYLRLKYAIRVIISYFLRCITKAIKILFWNVSVELILTMLWWQLWNHFLVLVRKKSSKYLQNIQVSFIFMKICVLYSHTAYKDINTMGNVSAVLWRMLSTFGDTAIILGIICLSFLFTVFDVHHSTGWYRLYQCWYYPSTLMNILNSTEHPQLFFLHRPPPGWSTDPRFPLQVIGTLQYQNKQIDVNRRTILNQLKHHSIRSYLF